MKLLLALLCIGLIPCQAQDKQVVLEKIFTLRDPAEFSTAIQEAEKAGIPDQVRLEARFLYYIDHKDNNAIAKLSDEFLKLKDKFDPAQSEIFSVTEDWLAVVHYTQAIAALQKNDKANFKKHITEAFWLSPAQAPAYAPHIEKLHLNEAMASVTIKPDQPFTNIRNGKQVTFKDALAKNKAVLLHFWSPWAQETLNEDFVLTANELNKHDIRVVSVLAESSPELIEDATKTIEESAKNVTCLWTLDDKDQPLARTLRIQDAPTMVLINKEGKVLFNGHPAEKEFWKALQKISPELNRPDSKE
ncbi:hypothetical protein SAMN02745181_2986 [Rubritalea squalenifaciens DSM 18772]|uniref:Thioredoxin domain-containing protein n=1 Tax=Rubritalea squalenifaciens DSM 18772 TaxID=1123071 RepID=A0A1M6NVM7_9BACT|nr:hypothetical protein [Rubritalea squalenifaciens]SHJ99809.1 hypothetical protein SAMN02745181_2986 [Rubritalea squalenifaciens DSM 18772]